MTTESPDDSVSKLVGNAKLPPVAGSELPDASNVLRYIGGRHIDGENVNGAGFLRRPGEAASSVNWLEWFDSPLENQVRGVRELARLKYGATALLVSLNVGQTKRYIASEHPENLALSFVHDPLEAEGQHRADPSHSLIRGVPTSDGADAELVKDLLVDCIQARFPAKL